ncbi:MAG TPA: hypothetical protein PKB08_00445 [Burkholderiaceae bacterium]|nr:hypothetical protein [Burkholderiaceae bacterium]
MTRTAPAREPAPGASAACGDAESGVAEATGGGIGTTVAATGASVAAEPSVGCAGGAALATQASALVVSARQSAASSSPRFEAAAAPGAPVVSGRATASSRSSRSVFARAAGACAAARCATAIASPKDVPAPRSASSWRDGSRAVSWRGRAIGAGSESVLIDGFSRAPPRDLRGDLVGSTLVGASQHESLQRFAARLHGLECEQTALSLDQFGAVAFGRIA